MAKQFTVSLANSLEIMSGEYRAITDGTVMETMETGFERLSEPVAKGTRMREVDTEDAAPGIDVIEMDRRWTDFKEYANDLSVKRSDMVRAAVQPNSEFIEAQVSAVNRLVDKSLIDAWNAVAYGGKNGTVQRNLIANSTIAHAGTGFTVTKANDAIEKMKTRGIVRDGEDINVLWTAKAEKVFKMTAEVANNQYSNQMVIDKGYVTRWGPLVFRRIEDYFEEGVLQEGMLPFVANGIGAGQHKRTAILYVKKSFKRWRPLTITGVVTWEQLKRRWVISADAYVGTARRRDDAVLGLEYLETD
jgi:hypothetical protein